MRHQEIRFDEVGLTPLWPHVTRLLGISCTSFPCNVVRCPLNVKTMGTICLRCGDNWGHMDTIVGGGKCHTLGPALYVFADCLVLRFSYKKAPRSILTRAVPTTPRHSFLCCSTCSQTFLSTISLPRSFTCRIAHISLHLHLPYFLSTILTPAWIIIVARNMKNAVPVSNYR